MVAWWAWEGVKGMLGTTGAVDMVCTVSMADRHSGHNRIYTKININIIVYLITQTQ